MITAILLLQAATCLLVIFLLVRLSRTQSDSPLVTSQNSNESLPQLVDEVNSRLDNLAQGLVEVREAIHGYLEVDGEDEAVERDLRFVEGADEKEAFLLAEAVLERHPGSRKAFEKVRELYHPLAEEPNDLLVRREAVLSLKKHADRYAQCCPLEEYPKAREDLAQVDVLAGQLMNEVRLRQCKDLEAQIDQLEKKLVTLECAGTQNDLLDEIGKLDSGIDRGLLRQFDTLQARYDTASQNLVAHLQKGDANEKVRDYNLRALHTAKEAYESFQKGKKVVGKDEHNKEDYDIGKISSALGGWDPRHLSPATSTYISTVYAEVFQGLKPEKRVEFSSVRLGYCILGDLIKQYKNRHLTTFFT